MTPTPISARQRTRPIIAAGLLGLLALFAVGLDDPPKPKDRVPWTTSRVVGSPDPPPPFKVVRAFPNLKFKTARCSWPGVRGATGSSSASRPACCIRSPTEPDAKADLFFDLRKELKTIHLLPGGEGGRGGLRAGLPPGLREEPPVLRLLHAAGQETRRQEHLADGTRVSRFTASPGRDPPRIDPASEEIVLTFLQGGHNGGDLHFGPDGMLYISTGDAASPNPPDPLNTGQDISDLLSSILRIDVDRKDEGKNYAVPKDNPFVGHEGSAGRRSGPTASATPGG